MTRLSQLCYISLRDSADLNLFGPVKYIKDGLGFVARDFIILKS